MSLHAFGTHQPLLFAACLLTEGPIVELGAGFYSTPFLHALSLAQRRPVHTVESQPGFLNQLARYGSDLHRLWLLDEQMERDPEGKILLGDRTRKQVVAAQAAFLDEHFGAMDISVAFVDHSPAFLRQPAVAWLADRADYIVIHDTESAGFYRYDFSNFAHRLEDRWQRPNSTVLSNRRDCEALRDFLWARGPVGPPLVTEPVAGASIEARDNEWAAVPLPASRLESAGFGRMRITHLDAPEADVQIVGRCAARPERGLFWRQILKDGRPWLPEEDGWMVIEGCSLGAAGNIRPHEVDVLEIRLRAPRGNLVFDFQ